MSYLAVWYSPPKRKKKNREMTLHGEFYGYREPIEDDSRPILSNEEDEYIPPIKQIKSHVLFKETFKIKDGFSNNWMIGDIYRSIETGYEVMYGGYTYDDEYDHRQWIADELIKNGGITHDDYIDEANGGGYIP